MAYQRYRKGGVFDVFVIKRRNGEWEWKAYRVANGKRQGDPPKTLEKQFRGRVTNCRYPIDAIRTAMSDQQGDASDEVTEQMEASRRQSTEYGPGYMQGRGAS